MLTYQRLKELVSYNPETGIFTNISPRKKIRVGEVAGALDKSNGYIKLTIDKRHYYAHRLAFMFMTEGMPDDVVDHINGDRIDNRWCNLRNASRSLNQQNQRFAPKHGKSGLMGAHQKRSKWSSHIYVSGKKIGLGVFDTAESAHDAYIQAKRKMHEGCTI